jgi:hypothetical protein
VVVSAALNRPLKTGLVAGADFLIGDASQWRDTRLCGPLLGGQSRPRSASSDIRNLVLHYRSFLKGTYIIFCSNSFTMKKQVSGDKNYMQT